MIIIKYEGRFGNNLFQYCRALCEFKDSGHGIINPLNSKIIKTPNPQNKNNKTVFQEGFFQDKETVDLFKKNKSKLFESLDEIQGVFVHVRLGDIKNLWHSKIEYYEKALSKIDISNGYISSDNPNDKLVLELIEKYNLKPYNNNEEETIIFASRFTNKVLSLGTFSWWIGFLNTQKNIIAPDPSNYTKWHGPIFEEMNWEKISTKD